MVWEGSLRGRGNMYTHGIHVIVRKKTAQNCKVQLKINLKSRIYKYTDI